MDGRLSGSQSSKLAGRERTSSLTSLRKEVAQLTKEVAQRRAMNSPEDEERRELANSYKASFADFFRAAWHVVEPSKPLIEGYHTDACLCHLQAIGDGDIHRMVANLPPGFGKSTIFSVAFPAWIWARNPYEKFLCASYAMDLSIRDRHNCRMLLESEWYRTLFGDVFQLLPDQNQKSFYENDKRGFMQATATFASGTGKRCTTALIDDPNNAMAGQAEVAQTVEWFGRTWIPRLNDRENGTMLLVMQRLYSNDLTAHVLELGGWEHLCLPMEAELSRKCITSIGWEDPRQEDGELLCPALVDEKGVEELKHSQGGFHYSAQQNQAPVPSSGGQFKHEWLRYASLTREGNAYVLERATGPQSVLISSCWRFATLDLAISSRQSADYTVLGMWDMTSLRDLILIDLVRARLDNPAQMKLLRLIYQHYFPDYFRIERAGYQLALIQQALAEGIPCRQYQPTRDKVARASGASVWMENEKIFLLKTLTELPAIETELLQFPRGSHDDIVDNFSMACDEALLADGEAPYAFTSTSSSEPVQRLPRAYEPDEGEMEDEEEERLRRRQQTVANFLQALPRRRW
jgi:predicted phage terminase large subunit-like protein